MSNTLNKTEWKRLEPKTDVDIHTSDIPEPGAGCFA